MLKVSRRTIGRLRKLDRCLQTAPLIREAFTTGRINSEQAQIMAETAAVLPPDAEHTILEHGADQPPDQLKTSLRHLQEQIDPHGTQQRDEDAAARAEQRAHERAGIHLYRLTDTNLTRIEGYLDTTAAAAFLNAIDALTAPRNRPHLNPTSPYATSFYPTQPNPDSTAPDPTNRDPVNPDPAQANPADPHPTQAQAPTQAPAPAPAQAPDDNDDDTGQHHTHRHQQSPTSDTTHPNHAASPLGTPDLRTTAQRRHDAICEIGTHIHTTTHLPDHGGDRPHITATIPYQTLLNTLGGLGHLHDGTPLTPAACRHLACDANILPAVMNGDSQPLDLGRTRRHFNTATRRALALRDHGCTFPNCDRPDTWCEAHHAKPWYAGGTSSLTNAVLICTTHHRFLHHSNWTVRINPTDGRPDYYAPDDPTPRRNFYHRRPGTNGRRIDTAAMPVI